MLEAVIAEVVAERPFGLADDAGRSMPQMTKSASAGIGRPPSGATIATRRPPSAPANASSGKPFGQRHDRGDRQGGRAADEDVHPQRLAPTDRRRVVHADAAVDLVVQPDLAVRLVLVAGELDPVHPQVRPRQAGPVGSSV